MDPQRGLALLEAHPGRVAFEGIALGPGAYVDAAGRRVRVRPEHLDAVAERMRGVFLRDLHREDMAASVGIVAAARMEEGEVRFTGDIRLAPYVELVRQFWEHIRFSLGFRYDAAQLVANSDGSYDLPADFLVDHLALVPQGQYPNARLVRLLNQARGLTLTRPQAGGTETHHTENETMSDLTKQELEQLRQQRDDALKAADNTRAALEKSEAELAKARADLDAAHRLAEEARLELGRAKERVAGEVMKLELGAGKDFEFEARRKELAAMDLAPLDKLRGDLRLQAAEAAAKAAAEAEGKAPPASKANSPLGADAAEPRAEAALDLQKLDLKDALRLSFRKEAV